MSDIALKAVPALGGHDGRFEGVTLRERADLAIVSIATPRDGEQALAEALQSAFGVRPPAPGDSQLSEDGATRFLGMAPDLVFAIFEHDRPEAAAQIARRLDGAGYVTDQADVWVALQIDGSMARAALARICPLDLHPDAFPEGRVARTVLEHLGTIILRDGPETFLMLSARSSAGSFLHAVETSIRNVT